MADTPFQNIYSADRSNFQNFTNQLGSSLTDAQNFAPELSAMYPQQDQYDRAVVTRMLQQGNGYKYLNPRYMDFLVSEAPKIGMMQDMLAIGNGGTGNANNTSIPRAQDFPEFFKNWLGNPSAGNSTGAYGYGMFDANGMSNLWNNFISKYNNIVEGSGGTSNPQAFGYLSGLNNTDLYNLNRFAMQGIYGSPASTQMDRYLQNAYQTFDQSSLGWMQFLQQIIGNGGKI